MTLLKKPIARVCNKPLGSGHGSDHLRRIVVTLRPGNGKDVDDVLELRPERTRRPKFVAVHDVYTYILKCEANKRLSLRLLAAKQKKADAAARRRSLRIIHSQ